MITCRLKSLIAKISEDKGSKVTFEILAQSCGSTRQTISKLANGNNTRLTLDQFDCILKKLNTYGYSFGVSDLFEFK